MSANAGTEMELGPARVVWDPPSLVDYVVAGFVGMLQALALAVCAHLVWCRKWPPYVTKNVNLVVIATVSGVMWTFMMAVSCGYISRQEGDLLATCDLERFLAWATLCVHTVSFWVRVYRVWRILIRHDDKMWHTEHQILLVSSVSLIPVIITWAIPRTGIFDEVANTCYTTTASSYVTLAMDVIGLIAISYTWLVCARQLKTVRKQFNEYESMKRTLLLMTLALLSYPVVVVFVLHDDLVTQRRVALLYPLVTTHIMLWGMISKPFTMKLVGNKDYLLSYTKGFSELPSPAQLKASLAEQLSVDQLRVEFRRYIKTKVAQELIDFYLDSLDREEVPGFFERQAITMRIIDQYVREGAPDQVNISEECREKVLATVATSYDIFDDARAEVLTVMETNFQRDFVTTEGFRRIVDASEEEQRELRLLRARGMLPRSPLSTLSRSSTSTDVLQPSKSPLISRILSAFKKLPFASGVTGRVRGGHRTGLAHHSSSRASRVAGSRVDRCGSSGGGGDGHGGGEADYNLAASAGDRSGRVCEAYNPMANLSEREARAEASAVSAAAAAPRVISPAATAAAASGADGPGAQGADAHTDMDSTSTTSSSFSSCLSSSAIPRSGIRDAGTGDSRRKSTPSQARLDTFRLSETGATGDAVTNDGSLSMENCSASGDRAGRRIDGSGRDHGDAQNASSLAWERDSSDNSSADSLCGLRLAPRVSARARGHLRNEDTVPNGPSAMPRFCADGRVTGVAEALLRATSTATTLPRPTGVREDITPRKAGALERTYGGGAQADTSSAHEASFGFVTFSAGRAQHRHREMKSPQAARWATDGGASGSMCRPTNSLNSLDDTVGSENSGGKLLRGQSWHHLISPSEHLGSPFTRGADLSEAETAGRRRTPSPIDVSGPDVEAHLYAALRAQEDNGENLEGVSPSTVQDDDSPIWVPFGDWIARASSAGSASTALGASGRATAGSRSSFGTYGRDAEGQPCFSLSSLGSSSLESQSPWEVHDSSGTSQAGTAELAPQGEERSEECFARE